MLKTIKRAARAMVAVALAGSALAGSAHAAPHRPLLLTVEEGGAPAKAGAPTDNFEALHVGGLEPECDQYDTGTLVTNGRTIDVARFTGVFERRCYEGLSIRSGGVTRVAVTDTGNLREDTNMTVETGAGCVYAVGAMDGTYTIGTELIGPTLYGVARRIGPLSAPGCAFHVPEYSVMDLSDVEEASPVYGTQLG